MPIIAKNDSKPRELTPEGNYIGRCYKMIHTGTIENEFQGVKKMLDKVTLYFEIPELMKVYNEGEEEKPTSVSKEYTLSLYEKATLAQHLQSWRGKKFTPEELKGFDITNVLGAPCMINLIHQASKSDASKVYETITSLTPLPKGLEAPKLINQKYEFSVLNFDQEKFDNLPEFIQKKIMSSDEYKALNDEAIDAGADPIIESDDLPF